ncbi:N-acetyl-anhydromuramoyl-L-alanine amidase [Burkholderiales bacterium]|nr:N-acetyl-anhydromuramoyl-L-alanine amidase [Burkholderiales bacterium]
MRRATFAGPGRPRRAFDARGWLAGVRRVRSPNADARPEGAAITLVVVHGISLPPGRFGGDAIERLFTNRLDPEADPSFRAIASLRVSAHFLIRRDGTLVQFVACGDRAWHAGVSRWRGRERCNDFSIGIELEGCDERPYTARQYARLAALLRRLRARWPIEHVAGHSDVAPGRKSDPGPAFDWARLRGLLGPRRRTERAPRRMPARSAGL